MKNYVCRYAATYMLGVFGGQVLASDAVLVADQHPVYYGEALDDAMLDAFRGGFDMGNGLRISFGIMRSISINGELVSRTGFNFPDLKSMTPAQANHTVNTAEQVRVILPELTGAAIVQNSLNNQRISTLTEINTAVNSMALIKSMNASSTLQDALLGSVGVR